VKPLRVVVVGSGLAGLFCAEELARLGVAVTVLTAAAAGRDGASHQVALRTPWVLLTAPESEADEEVFFDDLLARGRGAARRELALVLATEARAAAHDLVQTLELCPLDDGPVRLPGDVVARGRRYRPVRPASLLQPLLAHCLHHGIHFEPHRWVVGFGLSGLRCTEVLSIDRLSGELRAEAADAIVLACGGVGAVFPVSTAPFWCRGSGLALATLAGAGLHRPELTQSIPVLRRGGFFPSSRALLRGRIVAGERDLGPAADLAEVTARIAAALRAGDEVWFHPAEGGVGLPGGGEGIEHAVVELKVALHHAIGGVAIDPWGRTAMPGLYACGEAAGGAQGVRRTMGTGLVEARIFAQRAARAAVDDLRNGLGVATASEERRFGACAGEAAALSQRVAAALGPLITLRPTAEVSSAFEVLEGWPLEPVAMRGTASTVRGWLEGTRLIAARQLLAGELASAALAAAPDAPQAVGAGGARDAAG